MGQKYSKILQNLERMLSYISRLFSKIKKYFKMWLMKRIFYLGSRFNCYYKLKQIASKTLTRQKIYISVFNRKLSLKLLYEFLATIMQTHIGILSKFNTIFFFNVCSSQATCSTRRPLPRSWNNFLFVRRAYRYFHFNLL